MNQNNCKYWNTKAISDTQSGSAKSEAVEKNSTKQQQQQKRLKKKKLAITADINGEKRGEKRKRKYGITI